MGLTNKQAYAIAAGISLFIAACVAFYAEPKKSVVGAVAFFALAGGLAAGYGLAVQSKDLNMPSRKATGGFFGSPVMAW